jgi:hypothetical protein
MNGAPDVDCKRPVEILDRGFFDGRRFRDPPHYRDARQPMQRRMRAAEAALPFVHPKLSVAANVYSFAAQMEELSRLRGRSNVIDAKPSAPEVLEPIRR